MIDLFVTVCGVFAALIAGGWLWFLAEDEIERQQYERNVKRNRKWIATKSSRR